MTVNPAFAGIAVQPVFTLRKLREGGMKHMLWRVVLALCLFVPSAGTAEAVTLDAFAGGKTKVKDLLMGITPPQAPVASISREVYIGGTWVPLEPTVTSDGHALVEMLPGYIVRNIARCRAQGTDYWAINDDYGIRHGVSGHNHYEVDPISHYATPTQGWTLFYGYIDGPLLPINTDFEYYVRFASYSAEVYSTTTFYGACDGQELYTTIKVRVPDLKELKPSKYYNLIGSNLDHPENHFGTQAMNDALTQIAKDWKKTCPKAGVLDINDMSLPWGGRFDIRDDWLEPHRGHIFGTSADIRKWSVHKKNREKLINLMCGPFKVYTEGDSVGEIYHYHLESRNSKNSFYDEIKNDSRIIECCDKTIPDECIILQSNGQPVDEYPNISEDCK
ncbi:MAG: hypothetical protein PHW69_04835 [Elusimicrobiaceae bacterium]|nr:hypothetical protein [Elusimicrobiaceae bacterium]